MAVAQLPLSNMALAVAPDAPLDESRSAQLAVRLKLPLLAAAVDARHCCEYQAILIVEGQRLAVQVTGKGAPGPLEVDFGSGAMRHRRKGRANEMLGRAIGVGKKPDIHVLDGTAGLGRDAFVLADSGCRVTLCERSPIVAELLRSGIDRALCSDDPWLKAVSERMALHEGEVKEMSPLLAEVDVIYLDPMFPARDKSAAVKKDMAVFQQLLGNPLDDPASDDLLPWALAQDVARVVVKRPARSLELAGQPPSHCIRGKTVRYDVYVLRSLNA